MNILFIFIILLVVAGIGFATAKAPRLTSVLFWALAATIFVSAALLLIAPGPFAEKAFLFSLSVPLIWAGLQFWCYWDAQKWRVTGGLIGLCLVGGAIVYFVEPSV